MPQRNIAGLRAVRDIIKKSPEKHDQEAWVHVPADLVELEDGGSVLVSCGTQACVAGWAVAIAGGKYVINEYTDTEGEVYYPNFVVDPMGNRHTIEEYGEKVLGLDYFEAAYLFCSSHSREDVLDMLKALIKGKQIT